MCQQKTFCQSMDARLYRESGWRRQLPTRSTLSSNWEQPGPIAMIDTSSHRHCEIIEKRFAGYRRVQNDLRSKLHHLNVPFAEFTKRMVSMDAVSAMFRFVPSCDMWAVLGRSVSLLIADFSCSFYGPGRSSLCQTLTVVSVSTNKLAWPAI